MRPENEPRVGADELRSQAEAAFQAKTSASSANLAAPTPEEARALLHELQVHQIELEMQNEELRRAQHELAISRARYFDLYDLAPVGYCTVSEKGLILEANLTLATLLGIARSTLASKSFSSFIRREDQDGFHLLRRQVLAASSAESTPYASLTIAPKVCELRLVKSDGTDCWTQLMATVAADEQGEKILRIAVTDISAKWAREAARRQEAQTQLEILNAIPAHVALIDPEGIIRVINESWRRFATANLLQGPEFSLGQNYLKVCESATGPCSDEAKDVAAGIRRVLCGEVGEFSMEYPCHSPTEQRWFRLLATPLREGLKAGAVVMHVNITERKLAEDALAFSSEMLERTGELAKVGGWSVDLPTMKLSWTRETFRIAEIEPPIEPPLAEGINLFAPEARPTIAAAVQAATDTGTPYDLELPLITAKGRHLWVRTQGFGEMRDGKTVRIFGTFQDITARREAEASLRASESLARFLVRAANVGLWDWDLATGSLYFSPEWKAQLGYAYHELPSRYEEWESRLHPEDRAATLAAVAEFQAGIRLVYDVEFRLRHRDGSWRWIFTQAELTRDASGRAVRMTGSHIDITARKAIEAALRVTDQRFNDLVNSTDGIVWEADATTFGFMSVSRNAERMLGYTVADWLQPGFWANHIHPDDRDRAMQYCASCTSRSENHDFEYRFTAADGRVVWMRDIVRIVMENGRPRWLRGLMLDITSQKVAEQLSSWEKGALEKIGSALSLRGVLGEIMLDLENQLSGALCSILLLDEDGIHLRHGAAPSLPESYNRLIDGVAIGMAVGSCGTAAYTKRQVVVSDIAADPLWSNFRELALAHGLLACWSTPILGHGEKVLGTFAIYYRQPHHPSSADLELIGRAVRITRIVIERKQVESVLRESEERFRQLADNIQEVFWITDPAKDHVIYVSPAYEKIWGRTCAQLFQSPRSWLEAIHPEDRARILLAAQTKQTQGLYDETYRIQRPDGAVRWIHSKAFPVLGPTGEAQRIVGTSEDITERRELEDQMRQSQKLQTIGTLAAGIAHDFNNILAAILGNTELALADTAPEHPARDCLHQIRIASDRARNLVRQILAFSSQQPMERHSLALGPLIQEAAKLLRATIPADVQIIISVEANAPLVLADPTEMHQVLVNLCTNSWHSFEDLAGRIEVKLQSLTLDAGAASRIVGLQPGRFACISISDNGKGMNASTMERIFDPFFTTKEPGKGVGLGLSVVHGIIKGCGGAIQVSSQPGQGTTFTLYLPSCEFTPVASVPVAVVPGRGNNLSILYIDDDEPLLAVTTRMLQRLGFRVTAFSHPSDAVQAFRDNPGQFDLAITDMHMPKTTGLKIAIELLKIRPNFPILLSSGNVDDELRQGALESGISAILSKPFSIAEFTETILRFSPIAHRS